MAMVEERGAGLAAPEAVPAKAGSDGAAPVDWAAVRLAYEGSAESIPKILQRFGATPWRFRSRRELEN